MKPKNAIFLIEFLTEQLAACRADIEDLHKEKSDTELASIKTIEKLGCAVSDKNETIDSLNRENKKLKQIINDLERSYEKAMNHALAEVAQLNALVESNKGIINILTKEKSDLCKSIDSLNRQCMEHADITTKIHKENERLNKSIEYKDNCFAEVVKQVNNLTSEYEALHRECMEHAQTTTNIWKENELLKEENRILKGSV